MLSDIAIGNLGVIVSAEAELSAGLTVLTGETGAGKTMVVTGLRLLSGGRADASRVRSGADKALVEARFDARALPDSERQKINDTVENAGGTADENGEYIVSRSVSAKGRSRAYLGGRSVPAAVLQEFSAPLLTIHGQNDQLRLLSPDEQLAALDRFDPAIEPLRTGYEKAYSAYRKLAKDLKQRSQQSRELAQEIDRLNFAIEEIDAINPVENEDKQLVDTIRRLEDVETLRRDAATCLEALDGEEQAGYESAEPALTKISFAADTLSTSEDPALTVLGKELQDISLRLSSISEELGSYLADLDADPAELDELLYRQQQLKSLTKKYADDIDGVIAWRAEAAQRLEDIDTGPAALEKLTKAVEEASVEMQAKAKLLSKARTQAARRLELLVTEEIQGLAMPKARLKVSLTKTQYSSTGVDTVELLLAPNASAEPRPLATSASGGELSRVMLALEVILSAGSKGATLVFDEVDAGVGGQAAVEIGRRLARLATRHQVLVVTHLPQVAAYADTHLHVAKTVSDESVTSGVLTLNTQERVAELARMLAGQVDSETAIAHAQELLEKSQEEVKGFQKTARD